MGVYNPLDQSYHWINVSAIPLIRPNETKPYQVYTIFDDITERKNSEEQLRQQAEELKTVMDLVPAAIWVAHDPECHNITGNQTANEFYEAKEGENVSAGPASGEPVPPRRFFRNGRELKAEELPMQEAAARNQPVEGSEFDVKVPSGKSLTLMGAASPLRDEKGKVRGAVAAFLDITARREIEEQNFEHLHILEQANVFVRDMDGKIIFWNMGAEKIYGYSTDEAIGRISNELLKTEFLEPLPDILRGLTAKGTWEGELVHTRKDGVKIISSSVWTFYQADKNHAGMIIEANTDITERKKAEEVAVEYSKNLEIANKELEAFSYSVSHDLQAPLRALDSFSELLIEDYGQKIDETGQDYLKRIRKATQTMSQLINDMLKLSRVIRSEIRIDLVNLSQEAEVIAGELQAGQPERKVKLVIAPDILVAGDRGLLDIALTNLLENAWKYTSKKSNALIEFGETRQNGEKVFFVRDNGIGFDMNYSDKLFQPFQRLHTDKEYPGTGIGLAIVQRIIRRHGGRIWVASEVGKGTTFYFTIEDA
jgi:PAS domain S-box-containing protein